MYGYKSSSCQKIMDKLIMAHNQVTQFCASTVIRRNIINLVIKLVFFSFYLPFNNKTEILVIILKHFTRDVVLKIKMNLYMYLILYE